jgi:hypothetical protein
MATHTLVIPSGINFLNAVADTMNQNGRIGQDSSIELPSLRRRAYLAVNETGVIPVAVTEVESQTSTFRGE